MDNRAYTLGNTIRVPRAIPLTDRTLIHELAHVWQYQTRGTGYISNSAVHQMTQGSSAYDVTIVPGQSILDYTAEQQAVVVEKFYANDPAGWRENADVVRMMGEVRRARPISDSQRYEDLVYGPAGAPRDALPPGRRDEQNTPIVPLIRLE